ncbi:hypothetical protein M404DRAFT_871255 [Pisolithus tinctorius Marx 270]|uniref:Uncharacterized protein n=1 Tax=Pisolithus tinctorius Marx 270 TaxID=870435 RepID=A0A0C3PQ84_PISTI|nr:hypothetical protein M404DRAFT_871255 [Pisolithus tinctorius Marx 270]
MVPVLLCVFSIPFLKKVPSTVHSSPTEAHVDHCPRQVLISHSSRRTFYRSKRFRKMACCRITQSLKLTLSNEPSSFVRYRLSAAFSASHCALLPLPVSIIGVARTTQLHA